MVNTTYGVGKDDQTIYGYHSNHEIDTTFKWIQSWDIVCVQDWCWASTSQFELQWNDSLTSVCLLDEDDEGNLKARTEFKSWKPAIATMVSVVKDGVQELVPPSQYASWLTN